MTFLLIPPHFIEKKYFYIFLKSLRLGKLSVRNLEQSIKLCVTPCST